MNQLPMTDDVEPSWPPALTIPQLGAYMHRSSSWAWRWANSPDFPLRVIIIGGTRYVSRAELDAWLNKGRE